MSAKLHELKVWPEYYHFLAAGAKTFEVRLDDRDFQVGDVLELQEYERDADHFTGNAIRVLVTYKMSTDSVLGEQALKPGYCVLGFREI